VTIAVANAICQEDHVDVRGEILQLKEAINTMVTSCALSHPKSPASRVKSARWQARCQAIVPASPNLERPDDSVNAMCGNLTAQVRNIATSRRRSRAETFREN